MLDGGYGYGCLDNALSVSLLRARDDADAAGCDVMMRYALYPHAGDMVDVTRQACAFHQPPKLAQGRADVWNRCAG